jgi:transglutaminase-like putative cysteine protease
MRSFVQIIISLAVIAASSFSQEPVLEQSRQLEEAGKFREATALLQESLEGAKRDAERKTLVFEIDRLKRVRLDYSVPEQQLREGIEKSIRGVTSKEFEGWIRKGWFDARVIDDTLRFVAPSVRNLFMRHQELAPRRKQPRNQRDLEQHTLRTADSIQYAVARQGTPFVFPRHFRAVMTVTVDADATPDSAIIRAWLPVPRSLPYQKEFTILESSSPVLRLAPDTSLIRSAYLEQRACKGKETVFRIEYRYTMYGVFFPLDPARIQNITPGDPAVEPYLQEGQHVVFTQKMRALSDSIVGKETNPMLRAKKIHDWISEHILYSYAREYSTIRNLSDYCLTKRYGDCGQHALLFITLCRLNGIPARWQSGWYTFPGAKDIHDWAEIYLPPYGWVPVDPDMGVFAMRYYTSLRPQERRRLRDFYFGGLEPYRMIANGDHCQSLEPPKLTLRSDNVDFQRGEVEWEGGNIYFDRYSYSLRVEELPPD